MCILCRENAVTVQTELSLNKESSAKDPEGDFEYLRTKLCFKKSKIKCLEAISIGKASLLLVTC